MAPERMVATEDQLKMAFVSSCIESVADATGEDYLDVFNRMDKVGLLEKYILRCYDTLHLESRSHITQDLIETLAEWEKAGRTA